MWFLENVAEYAKERRAYLKTPYFKTFLVFLAIMAVAMTFSVWLTCDSIRFFTQADDYALAKTFIVIIICMGIIYLAVAVCWDCQLYGLYKQNEIRKRATENISRSMLHNINSPLSEVRRGLDLISIGKGDTKTICTNGLSALDAIINLTQIRTQIEQNRNHVSILQPCRRDPTELVTSQKDCYELCARPLNVSLRYDLPTGHEEVMAYHTKIQTLVDNLVYNAIKYNKANGSVCIKMRVITKNKKNRLTIVVKDTGIGIAKKDQERMYEECYRVKNGRKVDGLGMGLALVESVVSFHGGKISCKSEIGVGTTFTVKLPLL